MIHTPNIQYREPEKSQMTNSSNINKVPLPIQMHKCIYIYINYFIELIFGILYGIGIVWRTMHAILNMLKLSIYLIRYGVGFMSYSFNQGFVLPGFMMLNRLYDIQNTYIIKIISIFISYMFDLLHN